MSSTKVLFLGGGRSGEHEISLISLKHVLQAVDRQKYFVLVAVVQKDGLITLVDEKMVLKLSDNPKEVKTPVGKTVSFGINESGCPELRGEGIRMEFDVLFPLVHGRGGEDGALQGLAETLGVKYVGCRLGTSAVGMDKVFTKMICEKAGIPVTPYLVAHEGEAIPVPAWPAPWYVKPAREGSSIGVSEVRQASDLKKALEDAWKFDSKAIIEPHSRSRELEVGVLGDRNSMAVSSVAEIVTSGEFYTYDAKYVEKTSELKLPADLDAKVVKELQDFSRQVFKALDAKGMMRIDWFMSHDKKLLLNEVNTIPGFTPISMYPKLMQSAGISYPDLITKLIELS